MNTAENINGYILFTNHISQRAYELKNGYILTPVKSSEEMFRDSYSNIPTTNPEVMALVWHGCKHPDSYYTYRHIAILHSFLCDEPAAFEYAVEYGIKNPFNNIDLLTTDIFTGSNFDKFSIQIPTLPQFDAEVDDKEKIIKEPLCDKYLEISYREAYHFFIGLEKSTDDRGRELYDQICSYVFITSMWNISEIRLLYENILLTAALYISVLESIIKEPEKCKSNGIKCELCGRELPFHYIETWRGHIRNKLNELEKGWGDLYNNTIMELRNNRHPFIHNAKYKDTFQELSQIYDKKYYNGQRLTIEDTEREIEYTDLERDLRILERTVRKGLVGSFFEQYRL